MRRESVLEFTLNSELYCFNTHMIAYVFELESYELLEGISPVIKGLCHHGSETIVLIDTLKLFSPDKALFMQTTKSVIVISDEDGGRYGMLVDEIVQIEEVEIAPTSVDLSSEDLVINHYKKMDKIINEIVPLPLLKRESIPPFSKRVADKREPLSSDKREYVLFKIIDSLYAIEACYVDEVVEYEGEFFAQDSEIFHGAMAIRQQAIQIAKVGEFTGGDLIIVKKGGASFGLRVSEVLDIEHLNTSHIDYIPKKSQREIVGYYNLNEQIIALVNIDHFLLPKDGQEQNIAQESGDLLDKEAHLIFTIDNREFALEMKHIRQVLQVEDVAKTKSSALGLDGSSIEYIAQWNNKGVDVIKLDSALHLKTIDDGEIILIEYNQKIRGILVDFIDDIYYGDAKDITYSSSDSLLLRGALFKEEKIIAILNPKKILEII